MTDFQKSSVLRNQHFESSSRKTPQFKTFARIMRNDMKKALKGSGIELHEYSTGHFYVSGFLKKDNKFVYFSISDVRFFPGDRILIRTAKNEKDYNGGTNHQTGYEHFTKKITTLFNSQL